MQEWDLAHAPHTDLCDLTCGGAHLTDFGVFAAPGREIAGPGHASRRSCTRQGSRA